MIIGANRKHSTIERPKKNGDKKAAESKETPNSNGGQQSPNTAKSPVNGFSNLQSTGK